MDEIAAGRMERRQAERARRNEARLWDVETRIREEAYRDGTPLVWIGRTNSGGLHVSVHGRGVYGVTEFVSGEGFAMKRALRRLAEGQRYRLVVVRDVNGMPREHDYGVLTAERCPPSARRAIAERFAALIAASGMTVGLDPGVLLYDDQDRGYRCSFSTVPREAMDMRPLRERVADPRPEPDGLLGWVYVESPDRINIQAFFTEGGKSTRKGTDFACESDAEAALRALLLDRDFGAFEALVARARAARAAESA